MQTAIVIRTGVVVVRAGSLGAAVRAATIAQCATGAGIDSLKNIRSTQTRDSITDMPQRLT